MNKNIIYKNKEKIRLDIYLSQKFIDKSRSFWQKHIKIGNILINNKKITSHTNLKSGDNIKINIDEYINNNHNNKTYKLKIIADTNDYVIIDKPSGLIVHPTPSNKQTTLVDMLLEKYPNIKDVGDNPLRPGIVHRLDKKVSGVMVVAKNQNSFEYLKKQFQNRTIKKIYLCLVFGKIEKNQGIINFNIARSKTTGKMVAKPKSQAGKKSITEFEVLKKYQHYTYLKIILHTGRTHQIRVHLNAINHPIVGEILYIPKKLKTNKKLDRLFLHAHQLNFTDLNNKQQNFISPLPQNLNNFLQQIT